jgi:H+/gluconate symporter-like permease
LRTADAQHVSHEPLHRVATIGAGTLDTLPQNGAVEALLAVCGSTHRESYANVAAVAMIGPAIIALGDVVESF